MANTSLTVSALEAFGCEVRLDGEIDEAYFWSHLASYGNDLVGLLRHHGLVVLRAVRSIRTNPSQLIELGRCFGEPLDNQLVGTPERYLLDEHTEIFVNSNLPPSNRVPIAQNVAQSESPTRANYQYPNQQGWHHDQSFFDTPPIVSILYGHTITEHGGETVYARTAVDLNTLNSAVMNRVNESLVACHAVAGFGRTEQEVKNSELLSEEALTATHLLIQRCPFTGSKVFFLSDGTQMDFVKGPFQGLSTGVEGEGASLMRDLIHCITYPSNLYVHDWRRNDVVISNNFSNIHAATWYEHTRDARVLWRVTVNKSKYDDER
jgi:alpha-ketoglutarate-dependent taurine dioxygenase